MKTWHLTLAWAVTASCLVRGDESRPLTFAIERTVAHEGFDGTTCWVHARAGAIPGDLQQGSPPRIVMTLQKLLLSGSDVFYALHETQTTDGGHSWSVPERQPGFARRSVRSDDPLTMEAAGVLPLVQPGDETTVCDFAPQWHAASQRMLGIGQTVWYRDNRVMHVRPRSIAYAVYHPREASWAPWRTVDLPNERKFHNAGAGSVQRVDLPGGDVLIPFYFKEPEHHQYSVAVCRCRFDGHTLHYLSHGNELTVPLQRGLYEPSLTWFQGRFFLTLRNDEQGYVTSSRDGLHYDPPQAWTFDDGSPLGNYNTQQHWVTHEEGLFLVYTRRGADNDHVFRHRAPLFISRVDTDHLHVIRDSEQILVPEKGARLGNFGVVNISPEETWVTVTEWMQPAGVEARGSDNRVYVAKLKWNRANGLVGTREALSGSRGTPWEKIKAYFRPPAKLRGQLGDYRSPRQFAAGGMARSPAEWKLRRLELREQWQAMLGRWPPLITDPQVEIVESTMREDAAGQPTIRQQQIRFRWTPREQTHGYLLVPAGSAASPAVISVFYEPETAIGQGSKPHRDFAIQLARRGFVTLSIGATKATAARTYGLYHPSLEAAQVQPLSMLAYAAANSWYVLATRPEVDDQRIGIVGHSFGGKWAMFAACLFDKFACAAWSDPGIVFDDTRSNINYWEPWYLGYHPPPWRKRGRITADNPAQGLYPRLRLEQRDLHELHALMAPRPFLVSGGAEDPIERWQPLQHSVDVNRLLGYEDRVAMTNRPDHAPNADSNEIIYSFFEHVLQPKR